MLSGIVFGQGLTQTHLITFKAHLHTDQIHTAKAINEQINYSVGPSTINKKIGYRASLTEKFVYKIIDESPLANGLRRVEYQYTGKILIEDKVDINNLKIVMPINTKTIYDEARFRCAAKGGHHYFYQKWSPSFRKCRLRKGKHYEEFQVTSIHQLNLNTNHLSSDFLVKDRFNLYFYFGSDFHSARKFGYAEKAFKRTARFLKKKNFKKVFNKDEKLSIFNKTGTIGKYQKFQGKINNKLTNIYFLMGNPDSKTPKSQYEFFRFFKHALKNASGISYIGHAGLGKNLNFDLLEDIYQEKIDYNENQKQIILLSACITYLQSSGFFFEKKTQENSLVLITNGLPVKLRVNTYIPQVLINLFSKTQNSNEEILEETYLQFRNAGATKGYFPMSAVESN